MNYQGLKEYQRNALSVFKDWLEVLKIKQAECARRVKVLTDKDLVVDLNDKDFPGKAWNSLAGAGKVRNAKGEIISPSHLLRKDGRGEPIPHVCMKIPTGGGKTLLGAAMVEALKPDNGIVLWITPSRAIFQQTWKVLADPTHNCRQRLERACGGKVKLMRKGDVISALAVENELCVMPVMLQAAGGERRDFFKIFKDSGDLPRFFPDIENAPANDKMLKAHPDLDLYDLGHGREAGAVRHSLYNVLKLVRPIIVLDEAQNAYTEKQRKKLCELNPRMILELTATPSAQSSNILVDVPGSTLQAENMIKLPLKVHRLKAATWQAALTSAIAQLDELQAAARQLRGDDGEGRYIRPMMLIRVERTGRKQRDGVHIHAEDVRESLLKHGARPDQIRVKTSEKDEIGREDLLSKECPIRFIITRDALREGWDCPFAYILTLLDTTTAMKALTQMTGRILRQPDAQKTGTILDNSHVFCFNRSVKETVEKIKKGLENEGMPDLKTMVDDGEIHPKPARELRMIPRRKKFAGRKIFLPRVLHGRGKKRRLLDYHADILRHVDWRGISESNLGLTLMKVDKMAETIVEVDFAGQRGPSETRDLEVEKKLSLAFFARHLGDVIPNPWLAADTAKRALDSLRGRKVGDLELFDRRFRIADAIKLEIKSLVDQEAERVFCEKLARGEICLELTEGGEDFSLGEEVTELLGEDRSQLQNDEGDPLERSLYQRVYASGFDSKPEKDFAVYVDGIKEVAWWHRLAANSQDGYALQGWRQNRVYPDFAVCVGDEEDARVLILETKGMHLSNEDTKYKDKLLGKLSAKNPRALESGAFALKDGRRERPVVLQVLMQDKLKDEFDKLAAGE